MKADKYYSRIFSKRVPFPTQMCIRDRSIGMGGLGYLLVQEDKTYKGPIDKFIPDDMKEELAQIASLEIGDTIFFIADNEAKACEYAGQIRTKLGEMFDLLEKNAYRFCFINNFPMFEYKEEEKKIGFTHNPFSMPQGGLEALENEDPLSILAYQYDICLLYTSSHIQAHRNLI